MTENDEIQIDGLQIIYENNPSSEDIEIIKSYLNKLKDQIMKLHADFHSWTISNYALTDKELKTLYVKKTSRYIYIGFKTNQQAPLDTEQFIIIVNIRKNRAYNNKTGEEIPL